jgi:lipid-A-disaccharide synthase-like uncharacterized protein
VAQHPHQPWLFIGFIGDLLIFGTRQWMILADSETKNNPNWLVVSTYPSEKYE